MSFDQGVFVTRVAGDLFRIRAGVSGAQAGTVGEVVEVGGWRTQSGWLCLSPLTDRGPIHGAPELRVPGKCRPNQSPARGHCLRVVCSAALHAWDSTLTSWQSC
jgi:hypothetical protein